MKNVILSLLVLFFSLSVRAGEKFTVLQWNIWQEGTVVPGGYDAIVNEIVRLKPENPSLLLAALHMVSSLSRSRNA